MPPAIWSVRCWRRGWLRRLDARALMLAGTVAPALFMACARPVSQDAAAVRAARAGAAWPARSCSSPAACWRRGWARTPSASAGLVLGLYYGGTGVGIVASALLVPPLIGPAGDRAWLGLAAWRWAWRWRAWPWPACWPGRRHARQRVRWLPQPRAGAGAAHALRLAALRLRAGRVPMFGVGYIGYMTFVIALLREQGECGRRASPGSMRCSGWR